jgi:hypothetical protein
MVPSLQPADWLIVDTTRRPRFGDIAVVDRSGRLVSHRVIDLRARRMRGDATDDVEYFLPADVLGTAVAVVHDHRPVDLLDVRARWTGRRIAARSWCAFTIDRLRRRVRIPRHGASETLDSFDTIDTFDATGRRIP